LCAIGELFWVIVKHDFDMKRFLEVVQYIGPKVKATQFEYKLEFRSVQRELTLSFLSVAENCFEDINEIFASNRCLSINFDHLMEPFLSAEKYVFEYKLTVQRILQTQT
jgi:hypothetical protein